MNYDEAIQTVELMAEAAEISSYLRALAIVVLDLADHVGKNDIQTFLDQLAPARIRGEKA